MKKPPIPTYIAHVAQPQGNNSLIYITIALALVALFYYLNKKKNEDKESK